ncbi:MAG: CDP-alcohol phosphatidyltransferase family protein [Gammaproteobacteria bacterium]
MTLSIYQLKPRFQQLLQPVLDRLAKSRVTPNQVTLFALGLSCAYGAALAARPDARALWIGVPFFMLLRMALNAIDGMLASSTGQVSRLGALLNEICDVLADAALYLPFALAASVSAPLAVLVVVAALVAEFAGVLALSVGVARRFDGPMGKSDRAFAFSVVAIMLWADAPQRWIDGALWLVLLLSLWTVFNRLRQALRAAPPLTR